MNRILRSTRLVAVCGLGLAMAACSGAGDQKQQAPSTLHAVMSDEADDLNPFTPNQQGKSQIESVIGTPMLYVDAAGKLTSKILSSWTSSSDAKTVTLSLKPGMRWSDGKPMTATDLKLSLTAYLTAKISSNAGRVGPVVGQDGLAAQTSTALRSVRFEGITAPDARTLTIRLTNPTSSWLSKFGLAGTYWPVLPSHVLGGVALGKLPSNGFFGKWPVSSGPFLLSKFASGQYVEVSRNPKSAVGRSPFRKVVFEILSTDQMTAKLQTGEVDYIFTVDPADVDRVKALDNVTVASHKGVAPELFGLNNGSGVFKDPRVRQAMLYAIDRNKICKTILAGNCTVPETNLRQLGPEWAVPTTGVTKYTYNPDKARQLLRAAGWKSSTKLTFLARTQRSYVDKAVTTAIGQLNAVGIKFEIRNTTTAQLLETIDKKSGWDAFWISGADFVVDPDEWADYLLCRNRFPTGANTSQYCDPAVDKLLDTGLRTADRTQRGELYKQAFTKVNQSPSDVYLYTVDSIVAYNSKLTGVVASGNLSGGYWDIAKWRWKS